LRAIKLLELEFGGPLFNRERANTHLTELGRLAVPHLQLIYDEAAQVKKSAKEYVANSRGTLSLGVMCTIAPHQFVELMQVFQKANPAVSVKVMDSKASALEKGLLSGQFDVAIYCLPGETPHPRTHAMPLFRERMMITLPKGHSLSRKSVVAAVDLHGEPYLDRVNCEFSGYADKLFLDRNITGPTVYQSERDDWILAMVAAGAGYGFMPQSSSIHPGVVSRPLIDPELWRIVNLVTVRGRPHSPAVGAFVREVMRVKWFGKQALAVRETKRTASKKNAED
jgi:DNA-binding transcriptional LysR family regulator